jgi:hypothetical protein
MNLRTKFSENDLNRIKAAVTQRKVKSPVRLFR